MHKNRKNISIWNYVKCFLFLGKIFLKMGKKQKLNIGEAIHRRLQETGRSIEWLSDQIGIDRRSIYNLLRRDYLRTDQLLEISNALEFDFFALFKDGENKAGKVQITIDLDGTPQTLKLWVTKLTAINTALGQVQISGK